MDAAAPKRPSSSLLTAKNLALVTAVAGVVTAVVTVLTLVLWLVS